MMVAQFSIVDGGQEEKWMDWRWVLKVSTDRVLLQDGMGDVAAGREEIRMALTM